MVESATKVNRENQKTELLARGEEYWRKMQNQEDDFQLVVDDQEKKIKIYAKNTKNDGTITGTEKWVDGLTKEMWKWFQENNVHVLNKLDPKMFAVKELDPVDGLKFI